MVQFKTKVFCDTLKNLQKMVILLSVGKMNIKVILENKVYLKILATKLGIGIIPKLIWYKNMCICVCMYMQQTVHCLSPIHFYKNISIQVGNAIF